MSRGDEPISPIASVLGNVSSGLSIREYFAAAAMTGLLGNVTNVTHQDWSGQKTPEFMAQLSVESADALIAELAKAKS